MPAITPFGWLHTGIAILAILVGVYVFAMHKVVETRHGAARLYLLLTALSAATALGIYKHGGFGVAHGLAVLTLLAIAAGWLIERFQPFGRWSPALQATAFTATFLFNMLPAITEVLLRLPPDDPFVDSLTHPLLQRFHGAFVLAFVIGLSLQIRWLRRRAS